MWIKLAEAQKTGSPTETYELLTLIKERVASGNWIFPLSYSHLFETAKIANRERRMNLSLLMRDISKGFRLPPFTEIQDMEVKNVFDAIKKGVQIVSRANVVDKWAHIDYLPPGIELPFDVSDFSMVVEMISLSCYESLNDGAKYANYYKKHREWLQVFPKYYQEDVFFYNYFIREFKQHEDNYKKSNITYIDVDNYFQSKSLNKNEFIALIKQMPALYCNSMFIYDMMRNPSKPINEHDSNDIAALCVAIPYCNVVIAERQWSNIAKYTLYLDSEFGTTIDTSLSKLATL